MSGRLRPGGASVRDPRPALGRRAEELAAEHLRGSGHRVVERNFRCAAGEIDLVTALGDVVVFVEVRSRSRLDYGTPFESVGGRKQRRIRDAATAYLASRRLGDVGVRFDVIAVDWSGGEPRIEHLEDVF